MLNFKLLISLLFIFFSLSLNALNLEKIKLQLQWKHQFEFAGFYAAQEKGFYRDIGIDVEFIEFDNKKNIVDEVLNENVDFGVTYSSLIAEYLENKPLIFVANYLKQSPLVLISQKNINKIPDLKNKKIMGISDKIDALNLNLMLNKFDISSNEFVSVEPSFNIDDFINKKVDAMVVFKTNEIYQLDKKGIEYNVFNPSLYSYEYYDLNLFTSKKLALNNPLLVEKFKNASNKGWEYALNNKEEIIDLIIKKYNVKKDKDALLFEAKQIEQLMLPKTEKIGSINIHRVKQIAKSFVESAYSSNEKIKDIENMIFKYKNQSFISLSKEEKEYIKNNPLVKIGAGESFEPFIFKNSKGIISGIDRDTANIIEEKTGLKIEFELGLWSKIQERALNREFDGLSSSAKTKEREKFYNYPSSYLDYTAAIIVSKTNPSKIRKKEDTKHKKVSIQKGNVGFEKLAKDLGEVEIVYYESIFDVLEAVVKNEVDFTILDESIFYVADKLGLKDFLKVSFLLEEKYQLYFPLSNEKPILASIFTKAIDSINEFERSEIKNKWFKTFDSEKISFTEKEKEYLYSKKGIDICIDPNWYPFEKIENGKHIGISSAFLKLFKEDIKVPFNLIQTSTWSESLEFIKNKQCDILPLVMKTKEREKYLSFTKPYITVPLVIVTKENVPFIGNLTDINNKKIGILKNSAYNEIIRKKYPNLKVIDIYNRDDAFKKVESGELFGYINALANISYQFQNTGASNLKISGSFDEKWELSIGVKKANEELLSIFEKLVNSIDSQKKQAILNKYISVKYENAIDYSLIYKILLSSFFIILFILYWVYKMKKDKLKIDDLYANLVEKDLKLEELNKKLELLSSTDKLTNIYNRRKIDEYLLKELERSKRTGHSFSVVMVDIDYFKKVNDNFGHKVGDEVLCSFSELIKSEIRKTDIFGRWGGEEFLIICPYIKKVSALKKTERLRKKIENYNFKTVGKKTASFGVTIYKEGDDINSIMERVDSALYEAKESGRNKLIFY